MASKSIVSNDRKCVFCDTTIDLHKHHIFYGRGRRDLSEQYGCWAYVCANHHNMTNMSVHHNKAFDKALKELAQVAWEKKYGTRDDFVKIFGRSYL